MSDANRAAKNPANFSRLTIEQRRAIASAGGRAAHANGRAHRFTSEEARAAGKRGGSTVTLDTLSPERGDAVVMRLALRPPAPGDGHGLD